MPEPPPLRIIGVDPGLGKTGWGVVDSRGSSLSFVGCGTLRSKPSDPPEVRLATLFRLLTAVFEEHRPGAAAVEQTYVNEDPQSALRLGLARGVAMLVPGIAGVPVSEYAPSTVKKSVTGSGAADKAQVQAMVRVLLPRAVFDGPDSVDALAIALTRANHRPAASLRIAAST